MRSSMMRGPLFRFKVRQSTRFRSPESETAGRPRRRITAFSSSSSSVVRDVRRPGSITARLWSPERSLELGRLGRLGRGGLGFLILLSGRRRIVPTTRRRHVRLDPLETERIFQFSTSQQSPGGVGMLLDDTLEQFLGLPARRRRPFTVPDCFVRYESPGVRLGILELRRVLDKPGANPIVLVAPHLHRQQPPPNQIIVRLPAS